MAVVDDHLDTSVEQSLARLFPLPLTPLESFMAGDSREGYPVLCDMAAHFDGCLDRTAFDAGLAFALARNPLVRSVIDPDGKRQGRKPVPAWIRTERLPRIDWAPEGTPSDEGYDAALDLTQEPGLRIFARPGLETSTVTFHFHHACIDGVGAFGFLEDFLAGYALAYGGSAGEVTPRKLEPERLSHRSTLGMTERSLFRKLTDPYVGAREGLKFFLQAPLPLAQGPESAANPSGVRPSRRYLMEICSTELTLALRRAASAAQANLNDLMLRDLFVALCRWNTQQGNLPDGHRLRILMPQNLRSREDAAMPAANGMSFSFLTRSARQCRQPHELLGSIQAETARIRDEKLSLYFLGSIASLQSAGLLKWLLDRKICFSSAVLSNVGDPTRRFGGRFPRSAAGLVVGNLVLQGISGTPPLRPLTRGAFCIINSARSMRICLKSDPRFFSADDEQGLLRTYLDQLAATAAGAPTASVQCEAS